MTPAVELVSADFAALVGWPQVLTDPSLCVSLAVDGIKPECAVVPTSVDQVSAALRYASEQRLALIPRGRGTKIALGNPPLRYDAALCVQAMNHVVHYEPADLTISVEPGMSFGDFQTLVGEKGLWLPLDPAGGAEATIGGIIAANAAGPLRQGFGGPRDMVLGLKFATPEGKTAKTGGRVVKNVAGYDLGKLLTGSLGSLGVIVEACLKLFPKPPERATFVMGAGNLGIARDLRRSILRSPLDPMRLVLVDSQAQALLEGAGQPSAHSEWELWTELGGSHRVIERCLLELKYRCTPVGAALSRHEDAETAWTCISNLAASLLPKYPDVSVLKAALPLASIEEFLSRAQQEAQAEGVTLASFAQVGVGIVHLCTLQATLTPNLPGLVRRLRKVASDLRGVLILEHAPLNLKLQVDVWGATGDDLAAMRKLKTAWDPNNTLSPGRVWGF